MIKVLRDNLKRDKITIIKESINTIQNRLSFIDKDLNLQPEKYDFETLLDILSQIYDDIGEFTVEVCN